MKKKKMELWLKIVIVIIILLFIFLIATFKKFLILKQVVSQYEEDKKSTNYYSKSCTIDGEITELWIYNNIKMLKYTFIQSDQLVQKMLYINPETDETWIIVENAKQKIAVKLKYSENNIMISSAGVDPAMPEMNDNWRLLQMAVITDIQSVRWNGKDAYHISFNFVENEEYGMWINKEDYRVIGRINGTITDNEDNTYTNIIDYVSKYGSVTEEDVKLPDLTGYIIKDNSENEME